VRTAALVTEVVLSHLSLLIAFRDKLDYILKALDFLLGQIFDDKLFLFFVLSNFKIFLLGIKQVVHCLIINFKVRDLNFNFLLYNPCWEE
jgi:hypothetical protein